MTVLVKFKIEIRFFHWTARESKIIDDLISTIICWTTPFEIHTPSVQHCGLKGLAMIFAGQENPFIIFRSKEVYIFQNK